MDHNLSEEEVDLTPRLTGLDDIIDDVDHLDDPPSDQSWTKQEGLQITHESEARRTLRLYYELVAPPEVHRAPRDYDQAAESTASTFGAQFVRVNREPLSRAWQRTGQLASFEWQSWWNAFPLDSQSGCVESDLFERTIRQEYSERNSLPSDAQVDDYLLDFEQFRTERFESLAAEDPLLVSKALEHMLVGAEREQFDDLLKFSEDAHEDWQGDQKSQDRGTTSQVMCPDGTGFESTKPREVCGVRYYHDGSIYMPPSPTDQIHSDEDIEYETFQCDGSLVLTEPDNDEKWGRAHYQCGECGAKVISSLGIPSDPEPSGSAPTEDERLSNVVMSDYQTLVWRKGMYEGREEHLQANIGPEDDPDHPTERGDNFNFVDYPPLSRIMNATVEVTFLNEDRRLVRNPKRIPIPKDQHDAFDDGSDLDEERLASRVLYHNDYERVPAAIAGKFRRAGFTVIMGDASRSETDPEDVRVRVVEDNGVPRCEFEVAVKVTYATALNPTPLPDPRDALALDNRRWDVRRFLQILDSNPQSLEEHTWTWRRDGLPDQKNLALYVIPKSEPRRCIWVQIRNDSLAKSPVKLIGAGSEARLVYRDKLVLDPVLEVIRHRRVYPGWVAGIRLRASEWIGHHIRPYLQEYAQMGFERVSVRRERWAPFPHLLPPTTSETFGESLLHPQLAPVPAQTDLERLQHGGSSVLVHTLVHRDFLDPKGRDMFYLTDEEFVRKHYHNPVRTALVRGDDPRLLTARKCDNKPIAP